MSEPQTPRSTPSDTEFDVVVVGAGSGGVTVVRELVGAGWSVALVSDGYVGGECPYVACMPSKSLLRSARARTEVREVVAHGGAAATPDLGDADADWARAVQRRDEVANHRDDGPHAQELEDLGVEVIRGRGVVEGTGLVRVDGDRLLRARELVLDTGSVPVVPDLDGLDAVPSWTSDEALTNDDRPARLLVLGGGAIGCELAQVYAGFGTEVTLVESADTLVPSEDPPLGRAMSQVLEAGGVTVRTGASVTRLEPDGDGLVAHVDEGDPVHADRVLVVVGRRPQTDDLGVETAGGRLGDDGSVEVDGHCRAADRLWAVGDVTGLAPYTHTANHQAGVVVDTLLTDRPDREVTPDAIPRAVFTEPPLGATGLTEAQARERGLDVLVAEADLAEGSRAGAEGEGPLGPDDASGGLLRLVADAGRGVLVGAAAIGPTADAWITEATLAIAAEVPIATLAHLVRPFPTYPEAYTTAYGDLLDQLRARS